MFDNLSVTTQLELLGAAYHNVSINPYHDENTIHVIVMAGKEEFDQVMTKLSSEENKKKKNYSVISYIFRDMNVQPQAQIYADRCDADLVNKPWLKFINK